MERTSALSSYLALFTSLSTLLCCALPSLLVLLGLGATVATVLSTAPWLVALSRHKDLVFGITGALIAGNFLHVYAIAPRTRARGLPCPADAAGACSTAERMSRVVLWISGLIYLVGFFSAYVLGRLLINFEG